MREARYFVVPEGEVVELPEPVVPVEPPLPTVPEDDPPMPVEPPVEPVPAEPAPEPMPVLLPVLEPRSFWHCSFAAGSVSWSHFALASLLDALPVVAPVPALEESLDDGELELPELDEGELDDAPELLDEGELDAPALDGEDALPELPELPP